MRRRREGVSRGPMILALIACRIAVIFTILFCFVLVEARCHRGPAGLKMEWAMGFNVELEAEIEFDLSALHVSGLVPELFILEFVLEKGHRRKETMSRCSCSVCANRKVRLNSISNSFRKQGSGGIRLGRLDQQNMISSKTKC